MDWYDVTDKFNEMTSSQNGQLSSLPEEWQRELAALSRLEGDVNNGAYLQFLANWGRESYAYASQALKKINARKMAEIIDRCQALVDEHFESESASRDELSALMPNRVIDLDGKIVKEAGSILPHSVVERIYTLSYEFMEYPDDLPRLGLEYYGPYINQFSPYSDSTSNDRTIVNCPSEAGTTLRRFSKMALLVFGWVCILIAIRCFRSHHEGLALLTLVAGVGSISLGRRILHSK
jgi:hypothetical protein